MPASARRWRLTYLLGMRRGTAPGGTMTAAHYKLELLAAALRRAQEIFDMGEDYAWQARYAVRTAIKLCREVEEALAVKPEGKP